MGGQGSRHRFGEMRAQQLVDENFTVAINVASGKLMQPDFAQWLIDGASVRFTSACFRN